VFLSITKDHTAFSWPQILKEYNQEKKEKTVQNDVPPLAGRLHISTHFKIPDKVVAHLNPATLHH